MKMKMIIKDWWNELIDFCFPRFCLVCERRLIQQEKHVCLSCLAELPYTHNYQTRKSLIKERLFLRIPYKEAVALLYFRKEGNTQKIIHAIKYFGEKECGVFMGKMLAEQLMQQAIFQTIDYIIPLPLHKSKYRKRGYNQSECIAKGIAQILQKPIRTDLLMKIKATESQTHQNAEERWINVKNSFKLLHPEVLEGKHVLLVDDVLTTGATIEAAAQCLLQAANTSISIASLAIVEMD